MRILLSALVVITGLSGTAFAQESVAPRVERLEREMRAVQRKVFPGGAGQTVEPQITGPSATSDAPGTPAGTALTDITARLNALEAQLTSLTSQIEQDGFKLRQIEDSFASYRRATEARLKTLETAGISAPDPAVAGSPDLAAPVKPAPAKTTSAKPAAVKPRAGGARASLIDAVERPDTDDAAEDLYIYGYRLWEAKLYPEAQAQLKSMVEKHPKHRRASYAQNLLGRAYLDEGKPALASVAFYDNYKKMPDGDRAPDSLYYLGRSLVKLKKLADACKVYDELLDVYPSKIGPALRADIASGKTEAKCK